MLPASVRWLPFDPTGLAGETRMGRFYNLSLSQLLPATVSAANLQRTLALWSQQLPAKSVTPQRTG